MKVALFNSLQNSKQMQYKLGAGCVFFSYLILYFLFLYLCNFLPYVFDNNETFSNLMHAQNLYNFGLKTSFGLTDEAFAILKEAHPYVYTHQGNFPRLYAFILYCLGARSAESQIFITTFTIGLAGIGFCYHYFAKYVSHLFSVIFCLLLMTDYIMFVQWQVSTWRVWHLFFFFSSYLCCHGINGKNQKIYIIASIINFACLFYMEIAYAAFVFLSSGIYLFLIQTGSWKKRIFIFFIFSIGAALGIGILIGQNIAYLGWDTFLQDLAYTFSARNQLTTGDQTAIHKVTDFYSKHKIAFWENFNSIEGLRNPVFIFKNFYRHCLLSYSPFLTVTSSLIILSTFLSLISENIKKKLDMRFYVKHIKLSQKSLVYLGTACFLSSMVSLSLVFFPATWSKKQIILEITKPIFLFIMFLLTGFFYAITNKPSSDSTNEKRYVKQFDSLMFIIYLLLSTLLACTFFYLNRNTASLAGAALQEKTLLILGGPTGVPLIVGTILFAIASLFYYPRKLQEIDQLVTIRKILPFITSAIIGFFATYMILPGYIISGYWVRSCSFTVFVHMVLYAWLFYVFSIQILNYFWPSDTEIETKNTAIFEAYILKMGTYLKIGLPYFLLFLFTYSWLSTQWLYIKEFPPKDFSFLQLFNKQPFHNRTIVTNTYAAPFSFVAHEWAYLDPVFGSTELKKTGNIKKHQNIQFQKDLRYLWLADAKENPLYDQPELFVCWQVYNFAQLMQAKPKCGDLPLIKSLRRNNNNIMLRELKHDESGRDRWSIIDLTGKVSMNHSQWPLLKFMTYHLNPKDLQATFLKVKKTYTYVQANYYRNSFDLARVVDTKLTTGALQTDSKQLVLAILHAQQHKSSNLNYIKTRQKNQAKKAIG